MENSKSIPAIIGKILLMFIFLIVLSTIVMVPLHMRATGSELGYEQYLDQPNVETIIHILSTITMLGAVWLVYYLFDKKRGLYLGWKQKNAPKLALEGCLWGIAFMTTTFLLLWIFRIVSISAINFEMNVISSMGYPIILFMGVAINEEFLSRGYLHGLIKRDYGVKATVIVNSILFALLHLGNPSILQSPIPLLNLFLAGVLFAIAREVTGGLWVPIGIHFTWNLFLGNVYGFAVSGLDIGKSFIEIDIAGHHLLSGGDFGAEGSIITSMVIVLFTVGIWKWYSKRNIGEEVLEGSNVQDPKAIN
ncbi:CPBP family intramembrane glutamic endopeptidase [Serpentinicella sp. ANB-PHB4]|uniref:CPBP family intramembrane glutamic endopeptidase n=1 Tax=Serpentinicella sp. ANB-PHB4 TaxID=3074076 RepID=UPI00285BBB08|nr:CPBP family intramembrane glutamic endopeptidase [Serpentinicella sp. ANB-PHB4]MDR5659978.1 CPBP family intramembrane glutamic endopeptidase [Serpentinicella sp. ANB-PHB4]